MRMGKDAPTAGQDLPPAPAAVTAADVEKAVRRLNELMSSQQRNLAFHVDELSGRTVITVLDATTNEVVRQIPAEEVLAASRALVATGTLLNERI
jgi:flagellar protein FlaG